MAKTTARPSRAVAARPNRSVAVQEEGQAPAFMRNDAGRGTENIGQEDISVPRLKLIQALSPELEEYNDLRAGHFFHSAAEHIFDEPFIGVPIYVDRRYILWNPRDSGGGILARSDDGVHWNPSDTVFDVKLDKKDGGGTAKWRTAKTVGQSGLANWGTLNPNDPNSPPAATLMYNYLLGFPEFPELPPAVLTFQRSGIKAGRDLNTKLKMKRVQAPSFGLQFRFEAAEATNRAGQKFYTVSVQGAGFLKDQELYKAYAELNESFTQKGLAIKDLESMQGEGGDDEAGEAEDTRPRGQRRY